ncbi:MAG: hypothetical protein IJ774_04290 [Selenomonadaceae bacterium]|nr:hypothetical protein [Selenomonadaceae bacterium]
MDSIKIRGARGRFKSGRTIGATRDVTKVQTLTTALDRRKKFSEVTTWIR